MKTESSQQRSSVCARGRNEKRMSWCKMRMFQQDGKTYFEVLWRMSKTKHWTNVSPPGCWARTARADACKQGLRKQCWGGRASRPLVFPAGCRQKQRVCVIRGWRWGAVEVKPWEADGCGGVWKRRNLLPLVQSPELLHLREPEVAQVWLSSSISPWLTWPPWSRASLPPRQGAASRPAQSRSLLDRQALNSECSADLTEFVTFYWTWDFWTVCTSSKATIILISHSEMTKPRASGPRES